MSQIKKKSILLEEKYQYCILPFNTYDRDLDPSLGRLNIRSNGMKKNRRTMFRKRSSTLDDKRLCAFHVLKLSNRTDKLSTSSRKLISHHRAMCRLKPYYKPLRKSFSAEKFGCIRNDVLDDSSSHNRCRTKSENSDNEPYSDNLLENCRSGSLTNLFKSKSLEDLSTVSSHENLSLKQDVGLDDVENYVSFDLSKDEMAHFDRESKDMEVVYCKIKNLQVSNDS